MQTRMLPRMQFATIGSANSLLFYATLAWGAANIWIAPHPPMVDLPQHAGQLALLKQLVTGESPWSGLFQVNPFTPYLIGFGLALPLSFVLPVAATLKCLLTCAYLAFVYLCVCLRKHFLADPRLDWLFLLSFFGFAFKWGFFTFLVAAPLALWLILLADRYAQAPSAMRGAAVGLVGLVLLFSHGLAFLFACGVGAALVTARARTVRGWLIMLWPFALLALALGVYFVFRARSEAIFQAPATDPAIMWQFGLRHEVLGYMFGMRWQPLFVLAAVVTLGFPWALGLRPKWSQRAAMIPFAVLGLLLTFVPHFIFETALVYQRFALFLLPMYAWMFSGARMPASLHADTARGRVAGGALLLLIGTTWAVLGFNSVKTWQFAREAADFDRMLVRLESGQRALALIYDANSQADPGDRAFRHYASWYQAEKGGLVDFNFAWVQPQIVRYRPQMRPPVYLDFALRPQMFEWQRHRGADYRYFFMRTGGVLAVDAFREAQCVPVLLVESGRWKTYEQRNCQGQIPDGGAGTR